MKTAYLYISIAIIFALAAATLALQTNRKSENLRLCSGQYTLDFHFGTTKMQGEADGIMSLKGGNMGQQFWEIRKCKDNINIKHCFKSHVSYVQPSALSAIDETMLVGVKRTANATLIDLEWSNSNNQLTFDKNNDLVSLRKIVDGRLVSFEPC
ncbi:hypothetical protein ACFOWX_00035 [Sphingorhabdus arenilitoris]|uniref:Uncharacterized protein n=1 Tax=Sphingorhabdus arenilitoris TaxID=1490041 RepID=A0ABV8RBV9_9SPHN